MDNLVVFAIPIFFIFLLFELFYSWKQRKNYYSTKDTFSNLGTGIVNQLTAVLGQALLIVAYNYLYHHLNLLEALFGQTYQQFLQVTHGKLFFALAAFILVDLQYYFYHRHSHEINLLWVTHIVHHSSERYNFSVALRQSAFAFIFNFFYYLPLAMLGIPTVYFVASKGINLIYQFFIHTQLIDRMGPLELILNTPSHHRVHHAREQKYLDRNYAGIFIIWDKLFGTFKEEEESPKYGIYPRYHSFNAIKANIDPIAELYTFFKQAKGMEKLKVLFKAPLYSYKKFKQGQVSKQISRDLDIVKTPLFAYFLFVIALILALFFIHLNKELSISLSLAAIFIIMAALYLLGILLDKKDYKRL